MKQVFPNEYLCDPSRLQEGCLLPRATLVPSLHRGVYYQNKEESELITVLNGDFRFSYQTEDCLVDFYRTDYDDTAWDTLAVPSMWQYHGYGKPQYPNTEYPIPFNPPYVSCENPVGYYRKTFHAMPSGRSILYFGGVNNAYFVYLNGTYVGFSKGSRLPAEFDVTGIIRAGENLLCVKVFTYSDATYLENQDMLLCNGIFRDVMLLQVGEVCVQDYHLRTADTAILLDVTLQGASFDGYTVTVEADGQLVTKAAAAQIAFRFDVEQVTRWNAEQPHLYDVYITLSKHGEVCECHSKKIGFVKAWVEGNRFLVNGQPITLKGINRHEHDPQNGQAITVERIRRELKTVKEHNMNAVRCSHYPQHPAFYEIASELGLYVMDEGDLETHGCGVVGDQGYLSKDPVWLNAYLNRTERMVERDKNESCIVIWSVGNEHGRGENIEACVQYLKERCGTTPVFNGCDNAREPRLSAFRANGYFSMESLTGYPTEGPPVLLLEYGHAMGNSPGLMEDTWDYVYRHRHIIGGYVWEYKNHGFYNEDDEGRAFYQYGGDFGDVNHWSNFSMDGYCVSDGTPKPSLRDCKNVLSPCYVTFENGVISVINTNDFRTLDYLTLKWEVCEDYTVLHSGEQAVPPVPPYKCYTPSLPLADLPQTPGARYFVNLRFYDETGVSVGDKQVEIASVPATRYTPKKPTVQITSDNTRLCVQGDAFAVAFEKGLLCRYEQGGRVLLDAPMQLNFYRAPTDNDGVVGWQLRWIYQWRTIFLKNFSFFCKTLETKEEDDCVTVVAKGKALPTARFVGFHVTLTYRVYADGAVLVEYEGEPFGVFPSVLPRIGVCFPLAADYNTAQWYGRGPEENYCDRKAHCHFGLHRLPVSAMNFCYDIPQECGNREETAFLSVEGEGRSLTVVGAPRFAFSLHDFSLQELEAARHRNELQPSDARYLYVDYKMRGLGSHSCGPNPEEPYELHPHSFRFAFMLCGDVDTAQALQLARSSFCVHTEALSGTYSFELKKQERSVIECNINRD